MKQPSWQVMQIAIPKMSSKRVAQLLGVTADYIRRWRREPASDDSPTGSGQRSILDRVCDLIDAVFLVNPKGVGLIVGYINAHHRRLLEAHALPISDGEGRACTAAELLTKAVEAVNSLNIDGCTNETYRELVELRDVVESAIRRVERSTGGNHDSEN